MAGKENVTWAEGKGWGTLHRVKGCASVWRWNELVPLNPHASYICPAVYLKTSGAEKASGEPGDLSPSLKRIMIKLASLVCKPYPRKKFQNLC